MLKVGTLDSILYYGSKSNFDDDAQCFFEHVLFPQQPFYFIHFLFQVLVPFFFFSLASTTHSACLISTRIPPLGRYLIPLEQDLEDHSLPVQLFRHITSRSVWISLKFRQPPVKNLYCEDNSSLSYYFPIVYKQ